MNAEESNPHDEVIRSLLVECDKALAASASGRQPAAADTPVEWQPRLEGDLACIRLLRQVLPRCGTPAPPAEWPFQHLGRFSIRRLLGQGAFGMVFLAADPQLGRDVALKVPRPEALLTEELRQRFVREARAAAALDHPNLVPVYEAGEVGPLCYIASAYCPGMTLSEWLKEQSQPVPPRLAAWLMAALADAVSHAHARGVIHRDLKPSNVLLQGKPRDVADANSTVKDPSAGHDSAGAELAFVPRITDFGLAKLIGGTGVAPVQEDGAHTRSGAVLGTPNYMAPEQASGKNKEIGPAADIYALGAILYELLAGRPPFRGETILDTLEQVRSREPLPPSRLRPKLPRDVETICLKCLQKEPSKRYASAAALADDLRRYLAGEPIQARPIRAWERGLKLARRRPALAALLAVSVLGPLALATVVLAYDAQLRQGNKDLKEALDAKEEQRRRAEENELAERNFSYVSDMNLAQQDWASARVQRLGELLRRQLPPPGALDLRGFEWHYWRRLLDHSARRTLEGHKDDVLCVACSPDGKLLASGGKDRTVRLWDAATGRDLGVLTKFPHAVTAVTFGEGGRTLAAASQGGAVRLFDVASRKERQTLTARGAKAALALAVGGGQLPALAVARADGSVEIWDLGARVPRHTLPEHKGWVGVAFSADGKTLASGGDDGILRLWDADTGKPLASYTGHRGAINGVAFTPDGQFLATAGNDTTVRLWDRAAKKETAVLTGHTREVWSVQFSPDGKTLVSAGTDATVRLWDAAGTARFALKGHTGAVRAAVFTPDGRAIVSAGTDRLLKLWDATRNPENSSWKGHDKKKVLHLAFAPDGGVLATGGAEGAIKLWEPATGRPLATLPTCPKQIQSLAFAPDGKHLAVACSDSFIHIYDRQTAKEVAPLAADDMRLVTAVAFSPDGKMLASGGLDCIVRVWDWQTRKRLVEWTGHKQGLRALAFSPDSKLLASCGADRAVKLWEPATGQLRGAPLIDHEKTVWSVAFSPDGRTLASGGEDSAIRLWDVDAGCLRRKLGGHLAIVRSLAFSPDGRTLASTDGDVKLWQVATGHELAAFTDPGIIWRSVAWAPRGFLLAGGDDRGVIALWDAGAAAP